MLSTRSLLSIAGAAVAVSSLTSLVPNTGLAQNDNSYRVEDLETPRTLALGTGVRASSASTAAVANNPSALPFSRQYHIEALTGYSPSPDRWTLGSAVVDSNTTQVAAGLSFRYLLGTTDSSYSGYDARVAAGLPFGDSISVGVAGRYISIQSDQAGDDIAEGFTLDGALTVQPMPGLRISALGYNLIEIRAPGRLDPVRGNLAPRTVGGSVAYTGEEGFSIGADVLYDLSTFDEGHIIAGGGAEYFAGGMVPIRLGYEYDGGRQIHSVSFGAGYVDAQFGVEAGFKQDVDGDNDSQFLFSARYFVQ